MAAGNGSEQLQASTEQRMPALLFAAAVKQARSASVVMAPRLRTSGGARPPDTASEASTARGVPLSRYTISLMF